LYLTGIENLVLHRENPTNSGHFFLLQKCEIVTEIRRYLF